MWDTPRTTRAQYTTGIHGQGSMSGTYRARGIPDLDLPTVPTTRVSNPRSHFGNIGIDNIMFRRHRDQDPSPDHAIGVPREDRPMSNYMKPATFDGTGSWLDYQAHFVACSSINRWTDLQKGLYLAASLRGQAQTVLGNMPKGQPSDYEKLTEALAARFAPANQTELYRAMLKERQLKSSETILELGEGIKRLTHLAYPTVPSDVSEMIAKDQFIDALTDFDMRLRIKQSRPRTLNEAIGLAVEIEAFCRAEKDRKEEAKFVRATSGADLVKNIGEENKGKDAKRQYV